MLYRRSYLLWSPVIVIISIRGSFRQDKDGFMMCTSIIYVQVLFLPGGSRQYDLEQVSWVGSVGQYKLPLRDVVDLKSKSRGGLSRVENKRGT